MSYEENKLWNGKVQKVLAIAWLFFFFLGLIILFPMFGIGMLVAILTLWAFSEVLVGV